MGTDLIRIGQKARKEPDLVFTSLYHHVTDVDNLRICYGYLKPNKATGVDRVDKRAYGEHLTRNLEDLSQRLKDMKCRPQPKRRSYIPKPGSSKGRPLGIISLEDKIVESAVRRVLEPIYEPVFEDSSYGYRPERGPQDCFALWARKSRSKLSKKDMLDKDVTKVRGYLNYYAITDDSDKCSSYVYHAAQILFKWINRKSQRRSYSWKGFKQVLRACRWPEPRIRKGLNPCRRVQAV